jgi:predicted CDP-diglyceride synthetase/phosphatidate cytidylyltransferase
VLLSSWIPRYRATLLTAAIVSLLTLINLQWAQSSVPAPIVRCNWFFALVLIRVTAIVCTRRVQDEHSLCVAHAGIEQQIDARVEEWRIEFHELHYQEGV